MFVSECLPLWREDCGPARLTTYLGVGGYGGVGGWRGRDRMKRNRMVACSGGAAGEGRGGARRLGEVGRGWGRATSRRGQEGARGPHPATPCSWDTPGEWAQSRGLRGRVLRPALRPRASLGHRRLRWMGFGGPRARARAAPRGSTRHPHPQGSPPTPRFSRRGEVVLVIRQILHTFSRMAAPHKRGRERSERGTRDGTREGRPPGNVPGALVGTLSGACQATHRGLL